MTASYPLPAILPESGPTTQYPILTLPLRAV
jgi:hypothetical protein